MSCRQGNGGMGPVPGLPVPIILLDTNEPPIPIAPAQASDHLQQHLFSEGYDRAATEVDIVCGEQGKSRLYLCHLRTHRVITHSGLHPPPAAHIPLLSTSPPPSEPDPFLSLDPALVRGHLSPVLSTCPFPSILRLQPNSGTHPHVHPTLSLGPLSSLYAFFFQDPAYNLPISGIPGHERAL